MSLHINMSEDAEIALKRADIVDKLAAITFCLGVLAFGSCILLFTVIFINREKPVTFETYLAPAEDKAPTKKPKVKELTVQTTSRTSTVAPNVIVSSSAAAIAMSDIDVPDSNTEIGTGLEIDMGLSDGIGSAMGDSMGFGSTESGGSALEGTLYDLKLTRTGMKTPILFDDKTGEIVKKCIPLANKIVSDFVKGGMKPNDIAKYYQSPTKLYASSFLVPACMASYGPKAFNADKKIKPNAWLALYRGKIKAPKSGRFRFYGTADDFLIVRINKKIVLEAGLFFPSTFDINVPDYGTATHEDFIKDTMKHKCFQDYLFHQPLTTGWWTTSSGLMGGTIFNAIKDREYEIEIMTGEIIPNRFGLILLIDDVDNPITKDGHKVLDIFRTGFSLPDMKALSNELQKNHAVHGSTVAPEFNEDSPIWMAVPN